MFHPFALFEFSNIYRYMISWKTTQRNIVKSKMCGIQPVKYEEDGYCEKGLMFDEYFLSKLTYDSISGSLSHLCIVSGVTMPFKCLQNQIKSDIRWNRTDYGKVESIKWVKVIQS